LSDFYKEYVKASIDDGTLVHIELTPIEEVISPELNQSVLMAQLTLYRSTSWRTKRLSEVEWRNTSKKKTIKGDGSPSHSHSESEPSSPPQISHPPQPPSPPLQVPCQEEQLGFTNPIQQRLLVREMLTPQPYLKSESPQPPEAYLAQQFFRPMGPFYSPQLFTDPNPFDPVGYTDPRIQRITPNLFVPPLPETPVPLNQSNIQLQ